MPPKVVEESQEIDPGLDYELPRSARLTLANMAKHLDDELH